MGVAIIFLGLADGHRFGFTPDWVGFLAIVSELSHVIVCQLAGNLVSLEINQDAAFDCLHLGI